MKILAEMPTGMGSKWVLAEIENDFYGGYGRTETVSRKLLLGYKRYYRRRCIDG